MQSEPVWQAFKQATNMEPITKNLRGCLDLLDSSLLLSEMLHIVEDMMFRVLHLLLTYAYVHVLRALCMYSYNHD